MTFRASAVSLVTPPEDKSSLVRVGLKKASSLDFSALKRKLRIEGSSRCAECDASTEKADQQYRRFLALQFAYEEMYLVPTKLIDNFWHAHILDTRAYQRDCEYMFGYFLHHNPYRGTGGSSDASQLASAFANTLELWCTHFDREIEYNAGAQHHAAKCSDCSSCSSCSR